MKEKRILLVGILSIFMLLAGCPASTNVVVHRVGPDKLKKHGVIYPLPHTVIQGSITVQKIIYDRGQFADWATEDIFVPSQRMIIYKFDPNSVKINVRGERDPDALFSIETGEGELLKKRELTLNMIEEGFLESAQAEVRDETLNFTVRTIGIVANVVSKIPKETPSPEPDIVKEIKKRLKTIQDKRIEFLTAINPELAVDVIKIILEELNKEEAKLLSFFRTVNMEEWTADFEFKPPPLKLEDKNSEGKLSFRLGGPLFIISNDGLHEVHDSILKSSIPGDFRSTQDPAQEEKVKAIILSIYPDETSEEIAKTIYSKKAPEETNKQGFYYRIPGYALVRLEAIEGSTKEIEKLEGTLKDLFEAPENKYKDVISITKGLYMPIAQFGPVVPLPSNAGSTQSTYDVKLYEDSGGLENLTVSSEPLDTTVLESLDKLGTSTGAIIEAIQAKKKAEQEAEDEIEFLKREREKLQLEKDIADLKRQLLSLE